jgi:hypothetical protein
MGIPMPHCNTKMATHHGFCSFSFSGNLDFFSIQVGMGVYGKVSSLGSFVISES